MIGVNNLITLSKLNPAKVNISVVEYFPSIQNLLHAGFSRGPVVLLYRCTINHYLYTFTAVPGLSRGKTFQPIRR